MSCDTTFFGSTNFQYHIKLSMISQNFLTYLVWQNNFGVLEEKNNFGVLEEISYVFVNSNFLSLAS